VLGSASEWYAVVRSGSRLTLLDTLLDNKKEGFFRFDYLVIPFYYPLHSFPALEDFIKNNCLKVAQIDCEGGGLKMDAFWRYVGYASEIFKVKK
jgi:hypothetical protein